MTQLNLDFNTPQNTADNQALYEYNRPGFGEQCNRIYEYLRTGRTLTVKEAMNLLDIGDPRARIRDLRDGGIRIEDKLVGNGKKFKVYYIQQP